MSNALALEIVTRGLVHHLRTGVDLQRRAGLPELSIEFSDLPPNQVKPGEKNLVNLFLYHVAPNPAWRNTAASGRSLPGEVGLPPLALNLRYLVTVFSVGSGEHAHHVLGRVMGALHDAPFLRTADLKGLEVLGERAVKSGLVDQIEQVKFSLLPLSPDELARLWSGLQTNLRLSVVYEASVVLIDSLKPVQAPLPVLSRGRGEPEGFEVESGLTFPTLTAARFEFQTPDGTRRQLDGGRLGDKLVLTGQTLADAERELSLVFQHPRFRPLVEKVARDKVDAGRVEYQLTNDAAKQWAAGFYTVHARYEPTRPPAEGEATRVRTSNAVSVVLRPNIRGLTVPPFEEVGDVSLLKVPVNPSVRAGQQASLFLDDLEIPLGPITEDVAVFWLWFGGRQEPAVREGHSLTDVRAVVKAENRRRNKTSYLVRLRVDGVDSLLFDPAGKGKTLGFDPVLKPTLLT